MDMVRSPSKMEILSKATSLRGNSKAMGYLNPQPTHIKDNSVMVNITGKGSTHGARGAIIKEDMRTDRRVDMECM
jgi:hypothetical protein